MPDEVQGQEPQGTEGTTGGLFDSYLQNVPEDGREIVSGYLKDAEKNVNSRLQEAAEIQKQFGPYKDVNLAAYDPQQLAELISWHQQVTADEDAFKEWVQSAAKETGVLTPQEEEAVEEGELTLERVQELLKEREQQAIAPLEERLTEWEELRTIDTIESQIRDDLTRIEAEHKTELGPTEKAMVIDLGLQHEGEDWIEAGFKRFEEITAAGQRAFVEQKSAQPQSPISTGGQEAFKPTTDWNEAKAQAVERLHQALGT